MMNANDIFTVIEECTGLSKEALQRDDRRTEVRTIRFMTIALLKKINDSPAWIGRMIKRDHSTIINAIEKHNDQMILYKDYARYFRELEFKLNSKTAFKKNSSCHELRYNFHWNASI